MAYPHRTRATALSRTSGLFGTQGPEFETIRFWDALDYIGLNEYYPLPDNLATADLVQTVAAIHEKFARPVISPRLASQASKSPTARPGTKHRAQSPPPSKRAVTKPS